MLIIIHKHLLYMFTAFMFIRVYFEYLIQHVTWPA